MRRTLPSKVPFTAPTPIFMVALYSSLPSGSSFSHPGMACLSCPGSRNAFHTRSRGAGISYEPSSFMDDSPSCAGRWTRYVSNRERGRRCQAMALALLSLGASHSGGGVHEKITRWTGRVRPDRDAGQCLQRGADRSYQRGTEHLALGVAWDDAVPPARQFSRRLLRLELGQQ